MMDHSQTLTLDEAVVAFERIAKPWTALEESFDVDAAALEAQEMEILLIEKCVISENLFSDNEELEEVDEAHAKLLFLPYVRAKLYFNSSKDRMKKLELAKTFYLAFLNLLDHYGVLPVHAKVAMAKIAKENYKAEREEKVARYKAGKAAEQEAANLEEKIMQGSGKRIEYLTAMLFLKAFQAIGDLEMIPQELEMLKFRQKLETDTEFKRQYDAEMAKPRPKPYFRRIDDGSEGGKPTMKIDSKAITSVGGTPITHSCQQTKLDVRDTLWQPDHAQPKMTMDDHADLEMRLMYEKMDREKEQQRLDKEKMDRLNEYETDDLDTLKARAWDDWKDENEKGAGNKMR